MGVAKVSCSNDVAEMMVRKCCRGDVVTKNDVAGMIFAQLL
jgi:hypothetical protein